MKPAEPDLLRAIYDAELPVEEFDRRLARMLASEDEMREAAELIAWFSKRYPTAAERMAYVRKKTREWRRR